MRRVLLAALAGCSILLAVLAGSASAAGSPSFTLRSVCGVPGGHVETGQFAGLQPGTTYGASLEVVGVVGTSISFTADANGEGIVGSATVPYPLTFAFVLYLNPDADLVQDPGEATILQGTITAQQPCHPPLTVSAAPTAKEQCFNGGWQRFGTFKNQGDCVSFVATGGKKPPAGP
jgi:hypothetical protein